MLRVQHPAHNRFTYPEPFRQFSVVQTTFPHCQIEGKLRSEVERNGNPILSALEPRGIRNLVSAWWALREQYQGVAPPVARTEADFDPDAKNHIPANVPYARYYLARIYQFQFYKAMCDAAGYKGPLNRCSFYGSKAAGAKLDAMLRKGASQPWQVTMKEMTGTDHLDAVRCSNILSRYMRG